ncbi:MAG: hypothetical protein GYA55_03410 [SAR324 cluster bacterium]|uniref:Uncharacterized protein n=1 Tax=SAR324 cluster bacterium TaxID=2024889 RepID=A0A7X9FQV3_9DELT|nr:hypothetical protein [SAR324 cluster bacterium]
MKIQKASSLQAVNQKKILPATAESEGQESEFKAFLNKSIKNSAANPASEQELFSALIQHQVQKTNDEGAIARFEKRLARHREILEGKGARNQELSAAKFALRDLVRGKYLSKDDATNMYSLAFNSAQLDSDKNKLSSSRVSDATKAVDTSDIAFTKYSDGTSTFSLRRLGESTASTANGTFEGTYYASTGKKIEEDNTSDTGKFPPYTGAATITDYAKILNAQMSEKSTNETILTTNLTSVLLDD